jgi:hypothetical protein
MGMGRRFCKDILYASFCQFPGTLVLFSYNQDMGARFDITPVSPIHPALLIFFHDCSARHIIGRKHGRCSSLSCAFGLPMIQLIDFKSPLPQGLVLCPTWELCIQITRDLTGFVRYLSGPRIVAVYVGASIADQNR